MTHTVVNDKILIIKIGKIPEPEIRLNQKYSNFFMKTNRVTGAPITIIEPEKFHDFMETVASDTDMQPELLLFLVLSCSGALRVTECLQLRKSDFVLQPEGDFFITVNVLKKKVKTKREIAVPDYFTPYIQAALLNKRTFDYIFIERLSAGKTRKYTRHDIRYRLDTFFGVENLCLHSMRHSMISFLVHNKETAIAISSLLKVSMRIVNNYAHTRGGTKLRDIHKKKAS